MSTAAPDRSRRLTAVLREEYETIFFAELRDRMRNQLVRGSEV